jgi:hypothetical protein
VSATAQVLSDVEAYLARVRTALADLPAEERDELLAEVEASIYETASETDGPVAARLGPAEDFAAELRAAAGLQSGPARDAGSLRDRLSRLASDARLRHAASTLRELAPIWWVARAYLAVAGVALLFDASWSWSYRAVPRVGSTTWGLVVIGLAAVASIALGLWGRRDGRLRRPLAALNVALLVVALSVLNHLANPAPIPAQVELVSTPTVQPGLVFNGAPVTNIYPYSRDGRLLLDVFLFTGEGVPLDLRPGSPDPLRRPVRTVDGRTLFNVYPVRYYGPGTRRVVRPKAAPQVRTPRLATPPLVRTGRLDPGGPTGQSPGRENEAERRRAGSSSRD